MYVRGLAEDQSDPRELCSLITTSSPTLLRVLSGPIHRLFYLSFLLNLLTSFLRLDGGLAHAFLLFVLRDLNKPTAIRHIR